MIRQQQVLEKRMMVYDSHIGSMSSSITTEEDLPPLPPLPNFNFMPPLAGSNNLPPSGASSTPGQSSQMTPSIAADASTPTQE